MYKGMDVEEAIEVAWNEMKVQRLSPAERKRLDDEVGRTCLVICVLSDGQCNINVVVQWFKCALLSHASVQTRALISTHTFTSTHPPARA